MAVVLRLLPVRAVTLTFNATKRMGLSVGHYCFCNFNYVTKITDGKFGSVGSSVGCNILTLLTDISGRAFSGVF